MAMNPNTYGVQPQQQQSYATNWSPTQQRQSREFIGAPQPTANSANIHPPQSQEINGNYQQQLSSSMGGLTINSMGLNIPSPTLVADSQPKANYISNGPQSQGQEVAQNISGAQGVQGSDVSFLPHHNLSRAYINGQSSKPELPSAYLGTSLTHSQLLSSMASSTPPHVTAAGCPAPPSAISPQSDGLNQMSINSANMAGFSNMPPTSSSTYSKYAQHSTLIGATQQPSANKTMPQTEILQPITSNQSLQEIGSDVDSVYSRMPPLSHIPSRSGLVPMQQELTQQSPMLPQIPGQSSISGQPLIKSQFLSSGMQKIQKPPTSQGQPSMVEQQQMQGQQPIPGQPILGSLMGPPPKPGQMLISGQQPMQISATSSGPSSISGASIPPTMAPPPILGQLQLTRQPSQPFLSGQPMPGQPPIMGKPMSSHTFMPGVSTTAGKHFMTEQQSMPGQQTMSVQQQQTGTYPGAIPSSYSGQIMPPQDGQTSSGRPVFNQPPGPGGMYQQQSPQYPSSQRRLDPDQMPNPIQVMIENQRTAGGTFVTNQPGLLPPLVTTKFVVQDQGNVSPRFVRSSLYCIPASADLLKTTALPFVIIVSPFARTTVDEYEPPIVDFGELGPIRCNRCKGYMSPNMQFIDAGRKFQCLMCKVSTEVPNEYFQHLDHTGQRVDKYERPELVLGTYEFLATQDYCRNNTAPEIPAFIFVIDVSYNTMKSGLVQLLCSQMKGILEHLPMDQGQKKSEIRVGFITYNSSVHFYNIKRSLAQPQMMVVGDVQEMFMPLLDGFLCSPNESEAIIDTLMEQIPKMFADTKETETVLYPAIQAGLEALKASNCAGKLLVFNSTLPVADAPGKLKNRDDRKLLGSEKEKTVLTPQCTAYNTLGHECVKAGCSVDMFLFNNSYVDIATLGQVPRLTGGEVYKYTYFQSEADGKRLVEDIIKNISRPIAFDSVMRVRTSAGIRATDFYGHYFMTHTTDVELASVDSNKSIAIEIKHDDKLSPEENVYIQIALLYTSCGGQRRLRVFNLALRATTTISDIFKSCDLDAIMLFLAKQACFKLMELTPKAVKENLIHRSAQTLACYRKHCTSPTSAGQLILPECLKLLPLYVSCLIRNDAISGGSDMTLDDRSYLIQFLLSMDLNMSVKYLYPRLIPIHNVDVDGIELPVPIRCTHEKIVEDGAYILENGVHFFIWLGQSLPQSFIEPLFGVQCTQQVKTERFAITGETLLAKRVRNIIDMIMAERSRYMRITCVRQNDKLETVFRHYLIEDRGSDGSASYVDFLCHMHKEIKELLS